MLSHAVVANYRDEVPTDTPYALPACVTQSNELPRSPGWFGWQEAIAQAQSPTPMTAAPDDLVIMPYTSGTTGKPKACMHTHRSALFTAVLQARWYRLGHDDVMTGFMPLFHVAGMQGSMNAAIVAALARADGPMGQGPDPGSVRGARRDVLECRADDDRRRSGQRRLPDGSFARLKVLTGGGATMPVAVAERLKGRFNLDYIEGYGMTETMSPTHLNPLTAPKRQCLGIAVHETDARVIDPETLEELGDGAVGEIIVHGPQVLQGYWNKPDADAGAFIRHDGRRFLRTGDLGFRDAEGYFFAVDRLKRMINVSGFKVWPAEVEAMMYEHPAIRECCVISSPDSYRGETVKALVAVHEAARSTIRPKTSCPGHATGWRATRRPARWSWSTACRVARATRSAGGCYRMQSGNGDVLAELPPGRLLHVNVIGCTIFAAISGSSAATTQVIGRMSLNELVRRGYSRDIAIGSLGGAGRLGFLIPPSNMMIIYGVLGDVSILKLFTAGVLTGLLLAGTFMGWVMLHTTLNRTLVPEAEAKLALVPPRERFTVIQGLTDDGLGYIARVTMPYLTIVVGFVLLLTLFPGIVTILPRLLYG